MLVEEVHLADRDQDVHQLAEEKTKSVLVEFVVHMFMIVFQ